MASKLDKATTKARKGVIVFLIFAISTFVFAFISDLSKDSIDTITPSRTPASPYLAPDQKLGLIPKPQIESLRIPEGTVSTFSLIDRTVLPEMPPVVNVFVINKPREKLGSTAKGREVASNLGLGSQEKSIADFTLFWQTVDTSRSLTYNKLLEKWNYQVDLQKEQLSIEALEKLPLDTSTGFYNLKGLEILSRIGINDNYFSQAPARVDYINLNKLTGKISTASSPRLAGFVRIAQFKSIEASTLLETYKPQANESIKTNYTSTIRRTNFLDASAVIITRGEGKDLVPPLTSMTYHQFNYGTRGVYKLLSSTDAFLKIQSGLGKVYWLGIQKEDPFKEYQPLSVLEYKIDGSKTSLIYIEPTDWVEAEPWTNYLQPYYLFEGVAVLTDGRDADFSLILPALADSEYGQ